MKYICTQCTGRSGKEYSFELDRGPSYCPWCGTNRHVDTIESYLRQKLDDARNDRDRFKEKYKDEKERNDELEDKFPKLTLNSDHDWSDEEVEEFIEKFDGEHI